MCSLPDLQIASAATLRLSQSAPLASHGRTSATRTVAATAARRRPKSVSTIPTGPSWSQGRPALLLVVRCSVVVSQRMTPELTTWRQIWAMLHPVLETMPMACLVAPGVAAAAADTSLPAAGSAKYDYTEGLHKTLIFFESMRSGALDRQRLAW